MAYLLHSDYRSKVKNAASAHQAAHRKLQQEKTARGLPSPSSKKGFKSETWQGKTGNWNEYCPSPQCESLRPMHTSALLKHSDKEHPPSAPASASQTNPTTRASASNPIGPARVSGSGGSVYNAPSGSSVAPTIGISVLDAKRGRSASPSLRGGDREPPARSGSRPAIREIRANRTSPPRTQPPLRAPPGSALQQDCINWNRIAKETSELPARSDGERAYKSRAQSVLNETGQKIQTRLAAEEEARQRRQQQPERGNGKQPMYPRGP